MKDIVRAAIYARVSTGNQAAQDISIPDQIAQCEQYCKQKDWQVVRNYVDAGASATNDNRVEFQAMIAEACSAVNPFNVVMVHSQSRFARNTFDLLHYTKKLEKAGVQFVSITQDVGTSEQADILRTILGAMDEYQSREASKHTSRSMLENTRQGFWNGSRPPYGYRTYVAEKRGRRNKKKLEVAPQEAEIVKLIFKYYVHGDGQSGPMGLRAIAYRLTQDGERTRKGGKFLLQFVQRVLTNETYVGRYYFNKKDKNGNPKPEDEWVLLETPKIVGDELFHAAKERLHHNSISSTPSRVINGPTLLAGIAHCGKCGSSMRIATGKGGRYRYYKCKARLKSEGKVCDSCLAPAQKLDDLVVNLLCDAVLSPEHLQVLLPKLIENAQRRTQSYGERTDRLKDEGRRVKNQLERILHEICRTDLPIDATMKSFIKELQDKSAETDRTIHRLEQENAIPINSLTLDDRQAFADAAQRRLRDKSNPKFTQSDLRLVMGRIDVISVPARRRRRKAMPAKQATFPKKTGALVPTEKSKWCRKRDSNSRPSDYKSDALPAELLRRSRRREALYSRLSHGWPEAGNCIWRIIGQAVRF